MARVNEEEESNGRLVGTAETSGELAERRRLQQKNLNILGLPKRKGWLQCYRASSWQVHVRQSLFCQKEKEHSYLSGLPDREVRESQGE